MTKFFLPLCLILCTLAVQAQDKILLINGKILEVKSVELSGNTISYRTLKKDRLRRMNPERAFSVQYADGTERVIYLPDPLDPSDFNAEEMRMFIKGEREADIYYQNTTNKVASAVVGVGSGLLTFYGLIMPALYSTVVGGFSPNIQKEDVSDPALRDNLIFREGYEKKCRDRKIKNSLVFGFGGFAVGFTAFAIIFND